LEGFDPEVPSHAALRLSLSLIMRGHPTLQSLPDLLRVSQDVLGALISLGIGLRELSDHLEPHQRDDIIPWFDIVARIEIG